MHWFLYSAYFVSAIEIAVFSLPNLQSAHRLNGLLFHMFGQRYACISWKNRHNKKQIPGGWAWNQISMQGFDHPT